MPGARRLTSAGVLDRTLSAASKRNEGMAGLSCAAGIRWSEMRARAYILTGKASLPECGSHPARGSAPEGERICEVIRLRRASSRRQREPRDAGRGRGGEASERGLNYLSMLFVINRLLAEIGSSSGGFWLIWSQDFGLVRSRPHGKLTD